MIDEGWHRVDEGDEDKRDESRERDKMRDMGEEMKEMDDETE